MKRELQIWLPEIQRFDIWRQKDNNLPFQVNFVTKKVLHKVIVNKPTDVDSLRTAMRKYSAEHVRNLRHFKSI
jgi:hypothetical protein